MTRLSKRYRLFDGLEGNMKQIFDRVFQKLRYGELKKLFVKKLKFLTKFLAIYMVVVIFLYFVLLFFYSAEEIKAGIMVIENFLHNEMPSKWFTLLALPMVLSLKFLWRKFKKVDITHTG